MTDALRDGGHKLDDRQRMNLNALALQSDLSGKVRSL